MKKFSTMLLKATILLFSFSALALAIILREQISTTLMVATIVVALILIIIIVALIVNEEPTTPVEVKKQVPAKADPKPKVKEQTQKVFEEEIVTVKKRKSWQFDESGDLLYLDKDQTITTKTDKTIVFEDIKEDIKEDLVEEPIKKVKQHIPNPFSIQLEMSSEHQENLVSLIELMESQRLIQRNPDYSNFDLLPQGIKYYQYNYKDIPIITIIKQRHERHKVMAGCQTNQLFEIAVFEAENYEMISTLYNHSQHMQGIISGGRYRMIDLETQEHIEKAEPQSVQLRIYHGIND